MLTLNEEWLVPAIRAAYMRRILFTTGESVSLAIWERPKGSLVFTTTDGQKIVGRRDKILKRVAGLWPICVHCESKKRQASAIMTDAYCVCPECLAKVREFYHCQICNALLTEHSASYNRRLFQTGVCADPDCRKYLEVLHGRLCCMKAEMVPCVCARSYRCDEHAPQGVHVGTHD